MGGKGAFVFCSMVPPVFPGALETPRASASPKTSRHDWQAGACRVGLVFTSAKGFPWLSTWHELLRVPAWLGVVWLVSCVAGPQIWSLLCALLPSSPISNKHVLHQAARDRTTAPTKNKQKLLLTQNRELVPKNQSLCLPRK